MIRIAALTSGVNVPSARFRVRQHIEPLRSHGIEVVESIPAIDAYASIPWTPAGTLGRTSLRAMYFGLSCGKMMSRLPGVLKSRRADLTWLERGLLPGRLTLEPLLSPPIVFDVDDAIWLSSPKAEQAARAIAARAAVVLAGNDFLADWFSRWCSDVRVIPTAVDTGRFVIAGDSARRGPFRIVWTGLSTNLRYLYAIEPALKRFLDARAAELVVVSDRPPRFPLLNPAKVRFIAWSPETEVSSLAAAQVGIMPLGTGDWERGKCSFKMLQYMASGLPVIVTPVGMNQQILDLADVGFGASSEDQWVEGLEAVVADESRARILGLNGRRLVEEQFSTEVVSGRLRDVFRSLC